MTRYRSYEPVNQSKLYPADLFTSVCQSLKSQMASHLIMLAKKFAAIYLATMRLFQHQAKRLT